jgi:hypothetical protein
MCFFVKAGVPNRILTFLLVLRAFDYHGISLIISYICSSVADPDPPDPYVSGPPGFGSSSQRYGSGSFYHHAKIVSKNLVPTVL